MTNENRPIFLCAEHFQICHFPTFFFSVVSPLILKKSTCILCMPGQEFRSLTWKLLLKYVVFCQVSDLLYLSPGSEAHYVSPGPCKAE